MISIHFSFWDMADIAGPAFRRFRLALVILSPKTSMSDERTLAPRPATKKPTWRCECPLLRN